MNPLLLVIGLCLLSQSTTSPSLLPAHDEIFCDESWLKVEAPKVMFSVSEQGKLKVVLILTGVSAKKWFTYGANLGTASRINPSRQIRSRTGKRATVYRFTGGVIVAYEGKAFFMSWQMVSDWEKLGGATGQRGLPTSDPQEIRPKPAKPNIVLL